MTRPILARLAYVALAALTTAAVFGGLAQQAGDRLLVDVPPMPWSQR